MRRERAQKKRLYAKAGICKNLTQQQRCLLFEVVLVNFWFDEMPQIVFLRNSSRDIGFC
jgi:hypothetical protein